MTTLLSHPQHTGLTLYEREHETYLLGDRGHWHRTTQPGRSETRSWVRGTLEDCDLAYSAQVSDTALEGAIRTADEALDPMPPTLLEKVHAATEAVEHHPGLVEEVPQVEKDRIAFLSGEEWEEAMEPFSPEEREGIEALQGQHTVIHHGPIEPYEVSVLPEEPDPAVGVHPITHLDQRPHIAEVQAEPYEHPIDQILEGVSDEDAPEALRQHLSGLAGHEVTMTQVSGPYVKPERGGKRMCATTGCGHSESRHNASGKCRTCTEGPCDGFRVEG